MLNTFFNYDFYGFFLIALNIYIYVVLTFLLFSILFSFDSLIFSSLNHLNLFNQFNFFYMSFIFLFLSLAGIPPFLGFLGKFLIVTYVLNVANYFFFFLLIFFNFFVIYFYIQNYKYLASSHSELVFRSGLFYTTIGQYSYFILVLFNFINCFSFFLLNDFFFFLLSYIF